MSLYGAVFKTKQAKVKLPFPALAETKGTEKVLALTITNLYIITCMLGTAAVSPVLFIFSTIIFVPLLTVWTEQFLIKLQYVKRNVT